MSVQQTTQNMLQSPALKELKPCTNSLQLQNKQFALNQVAIKKNEP